MFLNKKVFHLNANRSLADSPDYIVNKFEYVGGGGGFLIWWSPSEQVWKYPGEPTGGLRMAKARGSCMVRSLGDGWDGLYVTCARAIVWRGPPEQNDRQTWLKTLPSHNFVVSGTSRRIFVYFPRSYYLAATILLWYCHIARPNLRSFTTCLNGKSIWLGFFLKDGRRHFGFCLHVVLQSENSLY